MAKFKITFTATREMTPEEIRDEYAEALNFGEEDDPVDRLVEYITEEGIDFFSNEVPTEWDHTVTQEKSK